MKPTAEQLRTLRHMLGIDRPHERDPKPYRNHYAANPEDPKMSLLAEMGLVEKLSDPSKEFPYEFFRCTPLGEAAAFRSHRANMLPKKKRVYLRFLSVSDAVPGLTLRDFLVGEEFAEIRRAA